MQDLVFSSSEAPWSTESKKVINTTPATVFGEFGPELSLTADDALTSGENTGVPLGSSSIVVDINLSYEACGGCEGSSVTLLLAAAVAVRDCMVSGSQW